MTNDSKAVNDHNTDRVNDLIFICEQMIEILEIENNALRKFEPNIIQERLAHKTQLSQFYERHMKTIQRNQNALEGVDKDLLDHLRTSSEEMNKLLDQNAQLLKVAMDTNRRVLKSVSNAARAHVPHNGNYSENATIGAKEGVAVAVSINQEL